MNSYVHSHTYIMGFITIMLSMNMFICIDVKPVAVGMHEFAFFFFKLYNKYLKVLQATY